MPPARRSMQFSSHAPRFHDGYELNDDLNGHMVGDDVSVLDELPVDISPRVRSEHEAHFAFQRQCAGLLNQWVADIINHLQHAVELSEEPELAQRKWRIRRGGRL